MLKHVVYHRFAVIFLLTGLFLLAGALPTYAQSAQLENALKLVPVQKGQVEYSIPAAADISKCTMERIKNETQDGVRILDPNGLILREFIATNGSKSINQWRYFRDGLEVYRDIDSDGNKKADNYRWYNTAGTRWGVDPDEDGIINSWIIISVEEVSAELVGSAATGDKKRFELLLPTVDELRNLGVGEEKLKLIVEKVRASRENFANAVQQKILPENARWVQFSGTAPSTFPTGTEGSTQDVDYYENALCSVDIGGKESQIWVGTLIRIGKTWRALDCPILVTSANVNELADGNIFSRPPVRQPGLGGDDSPNQADYDKLMDQIHEAAPAEAAKLYAKLVAMLNIDQIESPEDRDHWVRTFVNDVSAGVQQGIFPGGLPWLNGLYEKLAAKKPDHSLAALVKLRILNLEYDLDMANNVPWLTARTKLVNGLESIVESYPDAPDTAEAMLQLAIEDENVGEDEKALARCSQIVEKFASSPSAEKARGAKARMQSIGKPLPLTAKVYGKSDQSINLAGLKNRIAVIYFWTTWMSEPDKEADKLKGLIAKYKDLMIIGVNLDNDENSLKEFIAANRIPWPQLFEKGGMDSSPANQLGIFSVPTIIVIGKDGTVINRNARIDDLEGIISGASK